jgi:aminoglycoside phosphotransferase (APT) family kinase protein
VLTGAVDLAPDPVLPGRDDLLDPATLVRAKYRIGESLRVVHRVDGGLVSTRLFPGRRVERWAFPDDRRLRGLADVLRPPADVAGLAGGRWVRSEVAEYAPERSLTVRCADAAGATVAYAKAYAPGTVDVAALAARYAAVADGLRGTGLPVASPRPLGWSAERHLLVLEAMPGERWGDLPAERLRPALGLLGRAVAAVHGLDVPGLRPFGRLAVPRVTRSAALVAAARPDLAGPLAEVAAALAGGPPPGDPAVALHGDCHPKNALVGGGRLALVDLDQAGCGPAAADVGSLLARLRLAALLGDADPGDQARLAAAFLDGYAAVRTPPPPGSLAWHTAAALVAEQAVRAVNRVRRHVLPVLDRVVAAAADTLRTGAVP